MLTTVISSILLFSPAVPAPDWSCTLPADFVKDEQIFVSQDGSTVLGAAWFYPNEETGKGREGLFEVSAKKGDKALTVGKLIDRGYDPEKDGDSRLKGMEKNKEEARKRLITSLYGSPTFPTTAAKPAYDGFYRAFDKPEALKGIGAVKLINFQMTPDGSRVVGWAQNANNDMIPFHFAKGTPMVRLDTFLKVSIEDLSSFSISPNGFWIACFGKKLSVTAIAKG